ncbi:MAG: hypothetical protein G8237_09085 [Magnetococcales bacterium]|nr:hypothetical protein [Magnetococcales bacterium]NGZ06499.1 hypothetical protein [Magnetococcales bacterium]
MWATRFPVPFGIAALLAFLGVVGWQGPVTGAVWLHVMLAIGAMPLIVAAMVYFTPVLTRSGTIPMGISLLPWVAMGAGVVAVWAVSGSLWLVAVAVPLVWLVVVVALGWMIRRAARAFGSPHPGLYWYMAASGCLLLGTLAILVAWMWPEAWAWLRAIHRHLNLLGFVGLAAIGTLEVLLPTAGGYADPQAGLRLRRDLKYAVMAVMVMSAGAAVQSVWWSVLGIGLWGWVVVGLVRPLLGHVSSVVQLGGAAVSLLGALLGFCVTLGSALWQNGHVSVELFVTWFLFPLVMGALTHLLPMWVWPGMPTPQRQRAHQVLGRFALLRAGSSWLGGGLLLTGQLWGVFWIGGLLLLFLGQVAWSLRGSEKS